MPSISDSIFLFVLALLLFGPKKLPVLARELGKWVGEFRRASNDFKMQMEEELRVSEQADRRKQIDAMEAAAPVTPALPTETPVHASEGESAEAHATLEAAVEKSEPGAAAVAPLPIATSGELKIMPPATGLPVGQAWPVTSATSSMSALLEAVPHTTEETVNHGD